MKIIRKVVLKCETIPHPASARSTHPASYFPNTAPGFSSRIFSGAVIGFPTQVLGETMLMLAILVDQAS